jgi:hypothetical protein
VNSLLSKTGTCESGISSYTGIFLATSYYIGGRKLGFYYSEGKGKGNLEALSFLTNFTCSYILEALFFLLETFFEEGGPKETADYSSSREIYEALGCRYNLGC